MISDSQLRTQFFYTLDWLCQVLIRYPEQFHVALVCIAYGDDNTLGETYGAPEALRQLATLTFALQQAFRQSDLVGRNGTDFWILFPYTGFSDQIYDKLMAVIEASDHAGLNIVHREIAIFDLPGIYQNTHADLQNSQTLIAHLKIHQATLASRVFRLDWLK